MAVTVPSAIRLSSVVNTSSVVPERVDVVGAEYPLCRSARWCRHNRPVHLATAVRRVHRPGQRHRVVADASGIDVLEQAGAGIAPQDDVRATPLDQLLDVAVPPPRRVPERLRIAVQQPRSLHVPVSVQDAHIVSACSVGDVGDLTREPRVLDIEGQNDDVLPRSDVRAETDREPGKTPSFARVRSTTCEARILRGRLRMTAYGKPGARMDRPTRTLAGEGDEPAQAWNRPIEAGATEPRIVKRDPDDHACPGIHGRGRGRRYDAGRAGTAQTAVVAPGRPDSATRQHDPSGRRGHNRHGREARHRAGTETRTNGRDPLPRGRAPRT